MPTPPRPARILNILDVNVDLFDDYEFEKSPVAALSNNLGQCQTKKERRLKRLKDKKRMSKRT